MTVEKTDVVVVGGGNVGSAAAYYLSRLGKKVVIMERDGVGTHASGFAYGALSPLGGVGIPGPVLPLAMEGMKIHHALNQALEEETGIDTHFQLKSNLTLAFNEEQASHLNGRFSWQQAQHGYDVQWLDRQSLKAIDSRISDEALGGVLIQGTAEVDPYRLVLALTQAAEKYGAEYRHDQVVGLKKRGDRVAGVATSRGRDLYCGEVVFAMGPWTGSASNWLNVNIPVGPLKGQILRLKAPGHPLECTIGWSGNYATTKPDGLLWAGTTEEEAGFDETLTSDARDSIMNALLTMLPSMEEAQLVTQTACLRPVCPDGLLLLGRVSSYDNVYIATGAGRKGILLGPVMAKVITDLIMGREIDVDIAPFAGSRFSDEGARS